MARVPDDKSQPIPLLRSSLQSEAKRYTDYTTLRALVVAIPNVGASINNQTPGRANEEQRATGLPVRHRARAEGASRDTMEGAERNLRVSRRQ